MWIYQEIRTLGDYITYHDRKAPDRVALCFEGNETSYAELDIQSNQVAHGLLADNTRTGERAVYLGKNSDDFFIALFGTVKAGFCFCPLNWRLSKPELKVILADVEASFAFVEPEYSVLWAELLAELGLSIRWQIVDPNTSDDPFRLWFSDFEISPLPNVPMEQGAIQLYTSGTTGEPKGVVITHDNFNHMRLCEHFEDALKWHTDDRFLVALPNFHLLAIGMSLQSVYNGMAILIARQFEPGSALRSISEMKPTISVFAPAMIQMLLDHPAAPETDFSSLRMLMYAGSPISLGLIKRAMEAMPCEFMQFYGATETSGAVTLLRPSEHELEDENKLRSCGRPLPLIELRIVDESGEEAADGRPGELWIRSPALASGYWKKPEMTAASFDAGWYHSGDIAFRDAEGLYYIHDRLKDMIISGGENIYSTEIESVLSTHPAVMAVAVIGVPDDRWGEAVKACVIPKPGFDIEDTELMAFCREYLAGYKIPKSIDFHESFPMTGSGKVAKKDMRKPFWEGKGRVVG